MDMDKTGPSLRDIKLQNHYSWIATDIGTPSVAVRQIQMQYACNGGKPLNSTAL